MVMNLISDVVVVVVVPDGHHFPMCDNPALVATTIKTWYRDVLAE